MACSSAVADEACHPWSAGMLSWVWKRGLFASAALDRTVCGCLPGTLSWEQKHCLPLNLLAQTQLGQTQPGQKHTALSERSWPRSKTVEQTTLGLGVAHCCDHAHMH